jgi:hypothetical protein
MEIEPRKMGEIRDIGWEGKGTDLENLSWKWKWAGVRRPELKH